MTDDGKTEAKEAAQKEAKGEIRGIIRLVDVDVQGALPLARALARIKGIGTRLAQILSQVIARELGVPKDIAIGKLSDEQLDRIEEIIKAPAKYGVPAWVLVRRRAAEEGAPEHLLGSELVVAQRRDIEREKALWTWRGFRHAYGKKVRGQRTRTTGRRGVTVGVSRGAAKALLKAKEAEEKKKGRKKE